MQHKYDNRKAGNEGMLAEKIYQQSCGESYRLANKREDCDGTDFVHESKKVDVKARKKDCHHIGAGLKFQPLGKK